MKKYLIGLILLLSSVIGYSQTYSPVPGRHIWFTNDGIRLISKHDGLSVYPKQKHALCLFADNFNSYTNNMNINDATNWITGNGSMAITKPLSDGSVYPTSSGVESMAYFNGTFTDDQYSQGTYINNGVGASYMGVGVRGSATGYYTWYSSTAGAYLGYILNGTYYELAAAGTSWANGDVVRLEINGNELSCYRNGTLDVSISGDGKITDNHIITGNPCITGYNSNINVRIDDFEGGCLGKESIPPVTELDSIIYLFADNFETFPTGPLAYDTLMAHFQVWRSNFYEDNQSIIDLNDGDHEKVFHSKILEGEYGAGMGFEINIPLDSLYDEIWVDLDVRAMPGFNGDETPGYWSGKFPLGGAYGGLNYSYYNDSTRISSEEWGAWWVHTVWGNNESMHHYAYTLSGARNAEGYIGQIPTSWKHYSTKIKVSDPGSLNGTKEVFIDGDYASHLLGLKMRSIAQGKDYGLIEGAKLSFFFGGAGANYASQQDQWIEFDNIVVSYANSGTRKNTDLYTTGNKIWYPNSTLNNVQPDSILFCEDFTANSGTIQSHYTINRPPDSKRTYRKTITVTEGSHIDINFDYYRDSYNSWIKIYTGVGGSKSATPLYNFHRNNLASTDSTYHISDNEVTIEYCIGTSYSPSKGWKLTYESITP